MADTSNLSNFLEDVADAIRTKKETTEKIPAANFDTEILGIETGDTSDATATVNDILIGKTAYIAEGKVEGSMSNNGELNYEVSTSEQTIPAGYTSGGTIEAARQTNEDYDSCLEITNYILAVGVRYQPLEYI